MRLELTRPNGHYPLKVARLPIPPLLHIILQKPLACPEQDSNLHVSQHSHLKRARLPFRHLGIVLERKTRLELATPTLARLCSTNWAISAFGDPFFSFGIAKVDIFSLPPNFFAKIFIKNAKICKKPMKCRKVTLLFVSRYIVLWSFWCIVTQNKA